MTSAKKDTSVYINVKVTTCTNGVLFRGSCELIHLCSQIGELEILVNHAPFLSGIKAGSVLKIVDNFKSETLIELKSSGFLVLNHNECLITIEDAKIIDAVKNINQTESNQATKVA
jgi:F0F1-type ATP synthase epsilon subunit